jgi:hypothetical protein
MRRLLRTLTHLSTLATIAILAAWALTFYRTCFLFLSAGTVSLNRQGIFATWWWDNSRAWMILFGSPGDIDNPAYGIYKNASFASLNLPWYPLAFGSSIVTACLWWLARRMKIARAFPVEQ